MRSSGSVVERLTIVRKVMGSIPIWSFLCLHIHSYNLLLVPGRGTSIGKPSVFSFLCYKFPTHAQISVFALVISSLVAPLSNLVIFNIFVASSFQQIDAVQVYIKEVGVAWLRMWDLIFPFVINYKFVFFFCSTCLFEDELVFLEKLLDQRNSYYHHHHHHLLQNEKAQKIECIVDTYVAKSKLPIEWNILHTNGSETT